MIMFHPHLSALVFETKGAFVLLSFFVKFSFPLKKYNTYGNIVGEI
jgi:hypothetical protein